MPKLDRPGLSLHYERDGKGTPLLMIAGFMSDSASWAPLLPLLEPDFDLIRPDNRTCGQTTPWDAPVSVSIWVDDLIALIDALDLGPIHIVGHSLGGMIGWALAHRSPDHVASLLMIGSSPEIKPRNTHLFKLLLDLRRSGAGDDLWLRTLFPWLFRAEAFSDPDAIAAAVAQSLAYPHMQSADAMELQLNCLAGTDPTPFLAPPPVPSRAILSRNDLMVQFDSAARTLTGIELIEINDAGHSIHWDAPNAVAAEIRRLIGENSL